MPNKIKIGLQVALYGAKMHTHLPLQIFQFYYFYTCIFIHIYIGANKNS